MWILSTIAARMSSDTVTWGVGSGAGGIDGTWADTDGAIFWAAVEVGSGELLVVIELLLVLFV